MPPIDLDELLRILPQLIRENDTVKGAIITALSGVVATKDDIKALNQEMNQRFEVLHREIDLRFEKMDQRFEKMDQHIELGFAELRKAIQTLTVAINRIESKEGKLIEKVIFDILKEAFVLENINPEHIQNLTLVDKMGEIFYSGYRTDVDIVVENGNVYIFEIKATANQADIAHFLQNIKLYQLVTGKMITQAYLVALRMNSKSYELALNQGIKIIKGEIQDEH